MLSWITGYLFCGQPEQKRTKNRDKIIWYSFLGGNFIITSRAIAIATLPMLKPKYETAGITTLVYGGFHHESDLIIGKFIHEIYVN